MPYRHRSRAESLQANSFLSNKKFTSNSTSNYTHQKGNYMIAFQAFLEKLRKGLLRHYGEGCMVEIAEVQKNNGVRRMGIRIVQEDSNISPMLYAEELYKMYQDGRPLSEILSETVAIYEQYRIEGSVETGFIEDFSKMKDRILYRLVGYEKNRELLRTLPHIRFLDMAVIFYWSIFHDTFGSADILVKKSLCRIWQVGEESLAEAAKQNTPRLLPPKICDICDIMEVLSETKTEEEIRGNLYVLTNIRRHYGAACMLYGGILEEFAEKTGKSFYVLPSSVHEVLLAPYSEMISEQELCGMVRSINQTQVEPEEVLTDSAYFYDQEKQELRRLQG